MSLQEQATELCTMIEPYGYIPPLKAVVGLVVGHDCGDPRPPIPPLQHDEKVELLEQAKAALIFAKL